MIKPTVTAILVAVTGLVNTVYGEIIYSGPDQDLVVDYHTTAQSIDIAGSDEEWDNFVVGLWMYANPFHGFHVQGRTLPDYCGNHVMTVAGMGMVERLSENTAVNSSQYFTMAESSFFTYTRSANGFEESYGNYLNQTGFIGLRLLNQGDSYYGWAQISVENYNQADARLIVHDWAYNNVAEEEISTPDKTVIPEPTSMTMTSAVACGLLFIRRIFLI